MEKTGNDNFTISVNKKVKIEFKKLCEIQGLKAGKQIENFMAEMLQRGM